MTLHLDVRFAPRDLDLTLDVAAGEVVAVLGPNGAGKSTLLALLAGLLRPTSGRVELDGRVLADVGGAGRDVVVPPHRRGVGLLAQEALLFPHLDVAANVAFGPRSAGASRAQARDRALAVLAEVGMTAFADRRPRELSGGQAQRVAIARALAADPRLLLLDEPLAALDVGAAPEVRQVLRRVLGREDRSAVLVTHEPLDALALADRAVVVEEGRIVEQGPVQEVLTAPRSRFAAQLAGLDLLPGVFTPEGLRTGDGGLVTGLSGPTGEAPVPGRPGVAVFSPSAVAVHTADPGGSPRNRWAATVVDVSPRGEVVRLRARLDGMPGHDVLADVTLGEAAELDLVPGAPVHLAVKATAVRLHPTPGGERVADR